MWACQLPLPFTQRPSEQTADRRTRDCIGDAVHSIITQSRGRFVRQRYRRGRAVAPELPSPLRLSVGNLGVSGAPAGEATQHPIVCGPVTRRRSSSPAADTKVCKAVDGLRKLIHLASDVDAAALSAVVGAQGVGVMHESAAHPWQRAPAALEGWVHLERLLRRACGRRRRPQRARGGRWMGWVGRGGGGHWRRRRLRWYGWLRRWQRRWRRCGWRRRWRWAEDNA